MFKVIIAGGRDFDDYYTLEYKCEYYLINTNSDIEIVSGRCPTGVLTFTAKDGTEVYGADGLGEKYAQQMEYPVTTFTANFKSLGKKAGSIRNRQMAEYADALIAFWDGKSKGTRDMIKLAKENGLKVKVVMY